MNNSVFDSQTFSVHFVAAAPSITLMLDKNIVNKKAHDNNEFYMPAPDDGQGINRYAIKGGLVIKEDLYEEPPLPLLVENGYYPFYAVSRYKKEMTMDDRHGGPNRAAKSFEPYLESGLTPWFDIYPLKLPDEPVLTSIDQIVADDDAIIMYYDLLGHSSSTPFKGFNIVVARNGTHTTTIKSLIYR